MAAPKPPATRPRLGIYGHGKKHTKTSRPADLRLYTPKEVQALTGIATSTLANWRHLDKGLPYIKVGTAVRYEHSAIAAYIASKRIEPAAPAEHEGQSYGGLRLVS